MKDLPKRQSDYTHTGLSAFAERSGLEEERFNRLTGLKAI